MNLDGLVAMARQLGASDLHLEVGQPATVRVKGSLRALDARPDGEALQEMARGLLGEDGWVAFQERRSADISRVIERVRCRINVLHSARGVGLAVRLLSSFQPTLENLNLHADLTRLMAADHGLILITGPTGSGKTSTAAALLHQVTSTAAKHVLTLEQPLEYTLKPRLSFVRQREVGRDTPSFEQGLLDVLREDPDVILVGEMREPATMRLTLNVAETGHLVLATMHSATAAEALQRLVGAFPSEIQPGVCAQLADCLVAVVAQRLGVREGLRVPELEVLRGSQAARAVIRQGQFFKLQSVMESGGAEGHWTFARYRDWLDQRRDFVEPPPPELPDDDTAVKPSVTPALARNDRPPRRSPVVAKMPMTSSEAVARKPVRGEAPAERVLVLDEAVEEDPADILAALERKRR